VKRPPYTITNQGLQFYVEGNSSQFEALDEGDVFDIKLNCCETLSVKMEDGSQKDVDTPVVLSLRKEGLAMIIVRGSKVQW
jgi:hypothetical protein